MTLRVFIGYDPRQPVAYTVLAHSIARHSSLPVAITPLILKQLPIKRRGLTEFTYSRFLVPFMSGYVGHSLFLDADMVVTGDIAELFYHADNKVAVQVNKDQPPFEWASAMLFNNNLCRTLTTHYIEDPDNVLFDFKWTEHVGSFPREWNHFVRDADPNEPAKLFHFSEGIPVWNETKGAPEDAHWLKEHKIANSTVRWQELMGNSIHAERTLKRLKC